MTNGAWAGRRGTGEDSANNARREEEIAKSKSSLVSANDLITLIILIYNPNNPNDPHNPADPSIQP